MSDDRRRVLVVEDDDRTARLLREALEVGGYAVTSVSDVYAALEALSAFAPDVLVLDLMLPGECGLSLLGHLQSRRQVVPSPPVLVVTALCDSDVQWAARLAGAGGYLTKPFDVEDLLGAVARLLPEIAVPAVPEA